MISNILNIVSQVIAVLTALVLAVERPSEGAEKRAEVIAAMKAALVNLSVPGWAKLIFGNDVVLGVIVDLIVNTLNRTGWFGEQAAVTSPT